MGAPVALGPQIAEKQAIKLAKGKGKAKAADGVRQAATGQEVFPEPGVVDPKQVPAAETGHRMVKRSDAEKKKSSTLLSPFNERAVSVTDKLSTEEKELYQWLLSSSDGSENDVLFDNENVVARRSDLKTLMPQAYLTSDVLNAWTCHLNFQERLRSHSSPRRFFFTTYPCSFTIVDTPWGWSEQQVRDLFISRVEAEMEVAEDFFFGSIDMVFFPICHALHFYVIVFDLKNRAVVLLDNSSAMEGEPLSVKYGDIPKRVVRFFCEWMTANKFIVRGRSLINLPIQRLAMPWRDKENKVDSGVFAMRHMETYMGQRVRDWNIGLMANSAKALQELRVKYCRVLLATEANHVRKTNMDHVVAWFKVG